MTKYDIFEFKMGDRPSGKRVVEIHIKLPLHPDSRKEDRTYFLGFLTKGNIDCIMELYDEL